MSKFLQNNFHGRSYGSKFYGFCSIFFATRPFVVNNLFLSCVVTTNTASLLPGTTLRAPEGSCAGQAATPAYGELFRNNA